MKHEITLDEARALVGAERGINAIERRIAAAALRADDSFEFDRFLAGQLTARLFRLKFELEGVLSFDLRVGGKNPHEAVIVDERKKAAA